MTLQIVSRTAGEESVVELHGWLSGPEIGEFQAACGTKPLPLRIDLENLAGASADGILALQEQRSRGARLVGSHLRPAPTAHDSFVSPSTPASLASRNVAPRPAVRNGRNRAFADPNW